MKTEECFSFSEAKDGFVKRTFLPAAVLANRPFMVFLIRFEKIIDGDKRLCYDRTAWK